MKNKIILLAITAIAVTMLLGSCGKDEDEVGVFTAEEAKVEIRSANEQIMNNMGEMTNTDAFATLNMLMSIVNVYDYMPILQSQQNMLKQLNVAKIGRLLPINFPTNISTKSTLETKNTGEGGVWVYNFDLWSIEFVEPSDDVVLRFPSNDQAYTNRVNDAELRIANLQLVTIQGVSEPVNANVTLMVGTQTLMTMDYNATYNNDGMPTSMSLDVQIAPYRLTLSLSSSGLTYTSTLSLMKGDARLMGYSLTATFSANVNMEQISKIEGWIEAAPSRLSGNIQVLSLNNCLPDDINCANNSFDLQLLHIGANKIIGNIEARLYHDVEWNETYPELAIIYSDGTYEYLFNVMEIGL